jgi:N-methylhydantoinase A
LVRKATLKAEPLVSDDATNAIREHRQVWIAEEERSVLCPVYERDRLKAGNNFVGPAIVEQMDATTFILPGMIAHVDVFSNLILEAA